MIARTGTTRAGNVEDDSAGWVLLLPPPEPDGHILCLELHRFSSARAVAYWYQQVTAFSFDLQTGTTLITEYRGGEPVSCRESAWKPGLPLPFGSGRFAGCVWRLSGGRGESLPANGRIPAILAELRRVLEGEGFLYLDFDNRLALQKIGALLRGEWRKLAAGQSPRRWRQRLMVDGIADVDFHPFILENGRLSEIIPADGHLPGRNALAWRERLKSWLLRGAGAQYFATAYGSVVTPGTNHISLLSELVDRLSGFPSSGSSSGVKSAFRPGRIISTPGKAFVECLPDPDSVEALFVVVPLGPGAVARRRVEIDMMTRLKAAGFRIASLLPKTAIELDYRQHPVFVFSLIPGTAVDAPVPRLDVMIQRAYRVLIDLGEQSRRQLSIDRQIFQVSIGDALDGAEHRYAWITVAVGRLRAVLERFLQGQEACFVWLHGDYKLENLIFDTDTLEVGGVIDWELASSCGLPLLDLLYLLAYNRVTRGEATDVLEVIEGPVLDGAWSPAERAMIDEYVQLLGLSESLVMIIGAVFFIHHVGVRFAYPADDAVLQGRVLRLMDHMIDGLERSLPAGRAVRHG